MVPNALIAQPKSNVRNQEGRSPRWSHWRQTLMNRAWKTSQTRTVVGVANHAEAYNVANLSGASKEKNCEGAPKSIIQG